MIHSGTLCLLFILPVALAKKNRYAALFPKNPVWLFCALFSIYKPLGTMFDIENAVRELAGKASPIIAEPVDSKLMIVKSTNKEAYLPSSRKVASS